MRGRKENKMKVKVRSVEDTNQESLNYIGIHFDTEMSPSKS